MKAMKAMTALVACSLAGAALTTSASAQTWSPSSSNLPITGMITIQKGITFQCNVGGILNIDATGHAKITSLALAGGTGGICSNITFARLPYHLSSVMIDMVIINDVNLVMIAGNCEGGLFGTFNQSNGKVTFNSFNLPSSPPGGMPCVISGYMDIGPPAPTFTIP